MVDIVDLDPNTPTGQDLVSRGDDEIVRIKQALAQDFGGIDGPVFEDADVNGLNGTTLMTAAVLSSFNARIEQNADDLANFDPYIVGQIILWSGSIGSIPAGWALCDGTIQNSVQTPDLRDVFIRGAGGAFAPGDEGGSDTGSTASAGDHNHSVTVQGTALTPAQLPNLDANLRIQSDAIANNQSDAHNQSGHVAGGRAVANQPESAPVTTTGLNGATHTHSASSGNAGAHTHTYATVPPYYALAYIMYVGV